MQELCRPWSQSLWDRVIWTVSLGFRHTGSSPEVLAPVVKMGLNMAGEKSLWFILLISHLKHEQDLAFKFRWIFILLHEKSQKLPKSKDLLVLISVSLAL